MSTREPILNGRFLSYVCTEKVNYGYSTKTEVLKELRARLSQLGGKTDLTFRSVSRPIYGMQLLGFAGDSILQMVVGTATQVWKDYQAVDLPNGGVLYVEEVGEELILFTIDTPNGKSLSELRRLI